MNGTAHIHEWDVPPSMECRWCLGAALATMCASCFVSEDEIYKLVYLDVEMPHHTNLDDNARKLAISEGFPTWLLQWLCDQEAETQLTISIDLYDDLMDKLETVDILFRSFHEG